MIFDIGGGTSSGKKFKAVQTGGPSGGCIPVNKFDLPIDYDSLAKAGSIMGSGGMIVMDERTCMVDVARYFMNFLKGESCGKCTPCRQGTEVMVEILEKFCCGEGLENDIKALEALSDTMMLSSLCGLGQAAPFAVTDTLKYFRPDYERLIRKQ
jgi:NADH:ubiquinone oxidoreductase subunit F (NADH-binding)